MKLPTLLLCLTFSVLPPLAAQAQEAADVEQVRRAELAFAQTLADRDHEAFKSFLAEEAVFLSDEGALRGAEQVAAGWKPYFEGADAPFHWKPGQVGITLSGDLALSTGPVTGPDGTRIGTFVSTWQRQLDSSWKVILDTGCSCARQR
ncbi:MAG: nuclear transport factor 2 family protein [Candidatus Aminicenantes bacterium]|nr:MAG: nuclear transport factor 2 family protein [Candidatus Aminicenantes bacterium]